MTGRSKAEPSALVVGAGISGLTAAIALTRQGWRVRVQDRGASVDTRGAALGVWPEAWRGLETIEVTTRLHDAWEYRSATIRSQSGRAIGYLPLGRIESRQGAPVRLVARPALMAALVGQAEDLGIEVEFASPFEDDPDLDEYAVVLGADGINSKVRNLVAAGAPRNLHATAWRGSCAGLAGNWGEIWGKGMFAGVTPADHTHTNWYVAIADRRSVQTPAELRDVLMGWPREIQESVAATEPSHLLRHPLHDLSPLPTYARGKFALLGDAAHAMAPSLGQGACQAVLDALCVSRCLAEVGDVGSALGRYDRVRRPVGNRVLRRSRLLLGLQLSPAMAPVRDFALGALRPISPR